MALCCFSEKKHSTRNADGQQDLLYRGPNTATKQYANSSTIAIPLDIGYGGRLPTVYQKHQKARSRLGLCVHAELIDWR